MIYRCPNGFPVDQTKDGGDSSVRAGVISMTTGHDEGLEGYVDSQGLCVRHPIQEPWNNPKNFTKDQLKCLVAGLVALGKIDVIKKILNQHNKSGWCQNSERDAVGSTKMIWPHAFYKDSKPDTTTERMKFNFLNFNFEPDFTKLDKSKTIETKYFDHADPLLPNDWEFLKVAAGKKKPGGFGLWWHKNALKQHSNGSHNEENQMIAECFVLGTLPDFLKINKNWESRSYKYWNDRNEIDYHHLTVRFLDKYIKGGSS